MSVYLLVQKIHKIPFFHLEKRSNMKTKLNFNTCKIPCYILYTYIKKFLLFTAPCHVTLESENYNWCLQFKFSNEFR